MPVKKFDAAEALARLKNAQYRQSMYGVPIGTISEIAYEALNELDSRDAEVAERQATDDAAYKVWFAKTQYSTCVSAPMRTAWQECSRRAAAAKGELRAEIEALQSRHILDAETVVKGQLEYDELEAKLKATEVELARYRREHEAWEAIRSGKVHLFSCDRGFEGYIPPGRCNQWSDDPVTAVLAAEQAAEAKGEST